MNAPKKRNEMHVVGKLFAMCFVKREDAGDLVELYVEDDELYHFKTTFDVYWLGDLLNVTNKAKESSK